MSNYQQRIGLDPIEQRSGGSLPSTSGFQLDPIEQRSGGSLPPTTGGFQLDPIEQRSGGSLPPTTGFQLDPIEQRSGGSLPSTTASPWGRSVPSAPASGLSNIYDMFFGGD